MKKCFLLLILLSITACNDKTDEKIVTENNNPPVVVENKKSPIAEVRESEPIEIHMSKKKLNGEVYLKYDIVQTLPFGSREQIKLFQMTYFFNKRLSNSLLTSSIKEKCLNGNSFIQTSRGMAFQEQKNYSRAKYWYELGAQKGNAFAENRLGEMYLLGLGVEKDYDKARYWFEKSAEKGYYFAESALFC